MKKAVFLIALAALPLSLYSQQKGPAQAADEEEGGVLIDGAETAAPVWSADQPEEAAPASGAADPGALPASLGDVRGTLTDGGRSILVLQADDGTISFVQVVFGKGGVTWKPAGSLRRSRD
ncbi:MAG TPA: hypothetical protein PKK31_05080 [Elusimicrobiales bacterium]|nr:hypothetical protein [Elusimicrobiales bacterium]